MKAILRIVAVILTPFVTASYWQWFLAGPIGIQLGVVQWFAIFTLKGFFTMRLKNYEDYDEKHDTDGAILVVAGMLTIWGIGYLVYRIWGG